MHALAEPDLSYGGANIVTDPRRLRERGMDTKTAHPIRQRIMSFFISDPTNTDVIAARGECRDAKDPETIAGDGSTAGFELDVRVLEGLASSRVDDAAFRISRVEACRAPRESRASWRWARAWVASANRRSAVTSANDSGNE